VEKKLSELESLIKINIEKIKQKQRQIPYTDPLKYQKQRDVITNLNVPDVMNYIQRMFYYYELHECTRYLDTTRKMKPNN